MARLAPEGAWENQRKAWSYNGAVRQLSPHGHVVEADPRDPGNYYYAVVVRSIGFLSSGSQSYHYKNTWNDETLGDIFEAILGMAWGARLHPHDVGKNVVAYNALLQPMAEAIEESVRAVLDVVELTTQLNVWVDSKELARWLC